MKTHLKSLIIAMAGLTTSTVASAALLDLTGWGWVTYGNTNSYSLPGMATVVDATLGGGTGPGNPYYIASSPGAIKDFVVIYTGSSGQDVTTNAAGFENAYLTPTGSPAPYANTSGAVNVVDPGAKAGIQNWTSNTWDASLSALTSFLDGGNPVFLFNNNETNVGKNADQSLAIWAKLWITDPTGGLYGRYLYLSNQGAAYGLGGTLDGDATIYNPGNLSGPTAGSFAGTDYVMSGGEICFGPAPTFTSQACNGTEAYKINHNLGANQAAYAATVPLLDGYLAALAGNANLADYTLHLQLILGCDPTWGGNSCNAVAIDNGYEQLFLASTKSTFDNPEPATLALLGVGLAGLGAIRRRKMR